MNEVVIIGACRTAIGNFMGTLKNVSARELAMTAGKEAIRRSGVPAEKMDEICMGQIYTAMQGSLPARQVAMRIGLPASSNAVSVNQNCSSGMRALEIACHNIMLGKTDFGLVVGVESMTNAPYLLANARMGYRMGPGTMEDSMLHDGLVDELTGGHMGVTAENVAAKYGITRGECDELAVLSNQRAMNAIRQGIFEREITPVVMKSRKGETIFDTDEHPVEMESTDAIKGMRPAFQEGGVVTAANASGINDGASAVVVTSMARAKELGLTPLLRLVNICGAGVAPEIMGIGPAVAIPKCLEQANMEFGQIDYWEINEAFAAQWLGVARMLKEERGIDLPMDKVNLNGSGIALGHPVGSTGLRIAVSLLYEMQRLDLEYGGASLCTGGGPAMASLWTRNFN